MARPKQDYIFSIGEIVKTKYCEFTILDKFRGDRKTSDIKDKRYICRCNYCGETQDILEHTLNNGLGSCRACSDNHSYPSKFFYWFLKQTGIVFETEYSPKWLGRYRFDFHFVKDSIDYIVEVDGSQHYTHGHKRLTVDEVKEIDAIKDSLAVKNGCHVIRIACIESKGRNIEKVIKNSKLKELFIMDSIDWKKCSYMSISSKIKKFCDLWNSGLRSTSEISMVTGSNDNYISKCLQECSFYGLCDYDPKEAVKNGASKSTNGKNVHCITNGKVYESAMKCSNLLEEETGIHFTQGGITRVCRKERNNYKGYEFEYL